MDDDESSDEESNINVANATANSFQARSESAERQFASLESESRKVSGQPPPYRDYSNFKDDTIDENRSTDENSEEIKLRTASFAAGAAARASIVGPENSLEPTPIDEVGGVSGRSYSFPMVLHKLLEYATEQGYDNVVSWKSHGRAFGVHDQDRFVRTVMQFFFRQTRFSSFLRQLALYGFRRISTRGSPNEGCYYHEMFLRGYPNLCRRIKRIAKKGGHNRMHGVDPDFTSMPELPPSHDNLKKTEDNRLVEEVRQEGHFANLHQQAQTSYPNVASSLPWSSSADHSISAMTTRPNETTSVNSKIYSNEPSNRDGAAIRSVAGSTQDYDGRLEPFPLRNRTFDGESFLTEQVANIGEFHHQQQGNLLEQQLIAAQEKLFLQLRQNQQQQQILQQLQESSSVVASLQVPNLSSNITYEPLSSSLEDSTVRNTMEHATWTDTMSDNQKDQQQHHLVSQQQDVDFERAELGGMVRFLSDVDFDSSPEDQTKKG